MSLKEDPAFNERVERIIKALDYAVPKGSKRYEVVYALCVLLAIIFINRGEEDVDKDEYIFVLKNLIKDTIEDYENN